MSPLRFQIIVLRFIALWIRRTAMSQWSKHESVNLLAEVEKEVSRHAQKMDIQRTVPAGIQTRHGQAAIDVEDGD